MRNGSIQLRWAGLAERWRKLCRRFCPCGCAPFGRKSKAPDKDVAVEPDTQPRPGKWPDMTRLIDYRMSALRLDPAQFAADHSSLFSDMRAHCLLCNSRDRCRHDLSTNPQGGKWQLYCRNRDALRAQISAEGRRSSRD